MKLQKLVVKNSGTDTQEAAATVTPRLMDQGLLVSLSPEIASPLNEEVIIYQRIFIDFLSC